MRKRFGQRYLDARQFGDYLRSLKLRAMIFPEHFLEFLEEERLLLPVCRVEYPETLVRKYWVDQHPYWRDETLPVETDPQLGAAIEQFDRKLDLWPHQIEEAQLHPLDNLTPEEKAFVITNVADRPFRPWDEFRRPMGKAGGDILVEPCATSYYHHWQALLAIEIEGMAPHCLFNMLDKELADIAWKKGIGAVPPERMRVTHYRSVPEVREAMAWTPAFEAVAYFLAYKNRALLYATRDQTGPEWFLDGEAAASLRQREIEIAHEAARRWNVDPGRIVAFIKWQIERWRWWMDRDRERLAGEYKQHITSSALYLMLLTGKSFDDVANEVGRIWGGPKPALEMVVPNWQADQKRRAVAGLRSIVVPFLALLPVGPYRVTESECETLVDWLVSEDARFLWHFDRLAELGSLWDRIDKSALVADLEGLGLAVEHAVGRLMAAQGTTHSHKELLHKLRWLFSNADEVAGPLWDHRQIASKGVQVGFGDVDKAVQTGEFGHISAILLKAVTIRNQGTHRSLLDLTVPETKDAHRILLATFALIWKHAQMRGFVP